MARLELVRNDYGYDLVFTIKDATNTTVDVRNATIQLKVKKPGESDLTIDSPCSPIDAEFGLVVYTVKDKDFENIGRYIGELQITWTGNKIMTASDLQIDIVPDLA